jgi:alanyl-tRNA synthetase
MTKRLGSAQIRRAFLDFFVAKGHTEVASSPLVTGDATLIFTNAGMVQFKDAFLGLEKRAYARAATSQKCMRVSGKHNDLENVGPSARHHTFFEMLGNFSFGDYFKRDAIHYAYELLTQVYGLPPERLAFTVYENDDEAYDIWVKEVGVDPRRVARMGPKTNFWQMADTGPCGPTSEIQWDRCPEHGVETIITAMQSEDERFLELWNLVFMQYNRTQADDKHTGKYDVPLPRPGVDTGLGLERIASVVQSVETNYDTDLFMPIMDAIQEDLHHDNETREKNYVAYRVIADHGRAMTFLLSDGVLPGNEGAAYVLRMVMRRAMRFGKKMGVARPFLSDVARAVIGEMGSHYKELIARQAFILTAIAQEEERFQQTLDNGLAILDGLIAELHTRHETMIPGSEVFRLWDTFGFPIDLTRDVAHERGFTLDEDGFRTALDSRRRQSQAAGKFKLGESEQVYQALNLAPTEFVGYDRIQTTASVGAVLRNGQLLERALPADEIELVLTRTPFYAESGGQVGDRGLVRGRNCTFEVDDTQRPIPGLVVHRGRVLKGSMQAGDEVTAAVDAESRRATMRNHTATHLLHKALHEVLGEHATQKGSLVAPDRLRFDFNHLSAVTRPEVEVIERRVNEMILENLPVRWYVATKEEALRSGATALFGEKYGDDVRVVCVAASPHSGQGGGAKARDVGGCLSLELCGGTHVSATGEIGSLYILGEGSVAAGVRRIEAVTGNGAIRYAREQIALLGALSAQLESVPDQAPTRLEALRADRDALRREVAGLQRAIAKSDLDNLLARAQSVEGVPVVAVRVSATTVDMLREMSDWLRDRLGSGVVVLGAIVDDKPSVIASVTADLVARGLHAGNLVRPVAQHMGGNGGGRPNMAQAGGKDAAKLDGALALVPSLVERSLKK